MVTVVERELLGENEVVTDVMAVFESLADHTFVATVKDSDDEGSTALVLVAEPLSVTDRELEIA